MAGIITTTATMTTIITTEGGLLRLLAWLSPAFPTGAFAYSHGLEWAIEAGDIANETTLLMWLTDVLTHGSVRSDTILLRHAHRLPSVVVGEGRPSTPFPGPTEPFPGPTAQGVDRAPVPTMMESNRAAIPDAATIDRRLTDLADLAYATASGRERQSESLDQGKAFMLAAAPWGIPNAPERVPYPVAVGLVAGAHLVPEDATAVAYTQAMAANLISAAVRLVPLGQTAGLRVLAALEPVIVATAAATKDATLDDLGGCAFRSDLAAMRHETQYTRLFRS